MELLETIRNRESIRSYDPAHKIPRETLLRILEAGRLAPSASNLQPWQILVVESEPLLSQVKSTYPRDWLKGAPQIVIIKGSTGNCWKRKFDGYLSLETDLAIVMDHLILAATSENVATCWIAAFDPSALGEVLALKEDERVFAFTPLGYPAEGYRPGKPKERKPLEQIALFL